MNATEARKLIAAAEQKLSGRFKEIEEAALFNQKKFLTPFAKTASNCVISPRPPVTVTTISEKIPSAACLPILSTPKAQSCRP
ncbi:MAG: hypothetical protein ACLUSP_01155 [Christensenellales bacterium]